MIVSFIGDDKLVHGAYVSHESVPYILSMQLHETNTWCLCSERYHGLVAFGAEALTCIACWIVKQHHGYKWHDMVTG